MKIATLLGTKSFLCWEQLTCQDGQAYAVCAIAIAYGLNWRVG